MLPLSVQLQQFGYGTGTKSGVLAAVLAVPSQQKHLSSVWKII
jgi:hypothetical protein